MIDGRRNDRMKSVVLDFGFANLFSNHLVYMYNTHSTIPSSFVFSTSFLHVKTNI